MLTLTTPACLISTDMLARHFAAGASLAARSLKYAGLAEAIMAEPLGPERIARTFRLSACRTAKPDCAFVLLAGSIARYKAAPATWSAEPEARICRALVGGDFALISDHASKFVANNWAAIQALAAGEAEAA